MGSNLPPGVTASMIPGNRPEDMEFEEIVSAVSNVLWEKMEAAKHHNKIDIPDILEEVRKEVGLLLTFAEKTKKKGA